MITHPDKVIREQPPAAAQLPLPPSSVVPPYVHDDVTHRQAQLIVLLSLIVKFHHGLHCGQEGEDSKSVSELGTGKKVRLWWGGRRGEVVLAQEELLLNSVCLQQHSSIRVEWCSFPFSAAAHIQLIVSVSQRKASVL